MNTQTTIPVPSSSPPVRREAELSDGCDVTVVIPMRDEEANVAPVCAELQAVMDNERLRYEVIVINDGSEDGTAQELEEAVGKDPRFTVVEFARRASPGQPNHALLTKAGTTHTSQDAPSLFG